MKKALIKLSILLLVPSVICASFRTGKVRPEATTLKKTSHSQKAKKLFGYDPQYTLPEEEQLRPDGTKKIAVIVQHGFGAPNCKTCYEKDFPGNDDYFSVFFNFKDTDFFKNIPEENSLSSSSRKIKGGMAINIGQKPDAEVALYPIIELWKAGYETAIVGHSRGGTTAITETYILANPKQHIDTLKKFDLVKKRSYLFGMLTKTVPDEEQLASLRKSIIKVYLVKPMMNMNHIIPKTVQGSLAAATKYDCFAKQPIKILEDHVIKGNFFPFHFILAKRDSVVTNRSDNKLKELGKKADWPIQTVNEPHGQCGPAVRNKLQNFLKTHFRRKNSLWKKFV